MPDPITVALITHAGGAHVGAYLEALAATDDCNAVVLADPDGHWEPEARRLLGDKLKEVVRDFQSVLKKHRPRMALIQLFEGTNVSTSEPLGERLVGEKSAVNGL